MAKRLVLSLLWIMLVFGTIRGQQQLPEAELIVLGTVQDAGAPQLGCRRSCCLLRYAGSQPDLRVTALGLIDSGNRKTFLIDASPDLPQQAAQLQNAAGPTAGALPDGILLTHAHIGHYSGLMYLGREAANAEGLPVYTMPKMRAYLKENGPWEQLVALGNIELRPLAEGEVTKLSPALRVIPFRVPHRDEYSETVGFEIQGPNRSVLFIPDIDKWERWAVDIREKIQHVDLAFLDATFFDAAEIGYRDVSEIPHPFVVESRALFDSLPETTRAKIHFIHMNHTNPLLRPDSEASETLREAGYRIARRGDRFKL